MSNEIISIEEKSLDDLIILYNQGYRLDNVKYNDSTVTLGLTDAAGGIIVITVTILMFMISALLYYKVGKWEARKLGID